MNNQQVNEFILSHADFLAKVWFKDQIRNLHAAYYLFYRLPRKGETIATPVISTEALNSDWMLANPQRISIAWTKDQAAQFVADVMRKLPILNIK